MRSQLLVFVLLSVSGARASWFSDKSDSASASASSASAWSNEQYAKAQQAFYDIKDDTFDTWDESRLRKFLVDQGVVEPSGAKEQLVVACKQQYNSFISAASSFSSVVSTAVSTAIHGDATYQASKSASSLASDASNSINSAASVASKSGSSAASVAAKSGSSAASVASKSGKSAASVASKSGKSAASVASGSATSLASVVSASGASVYSVASASVSSALAQATTEVARKMDDTNDYVWSTWDESQIRQFLQKQGVVEPKATTTLEQLRLQVRDSYASTTNYVWEAWSDSYMRDWLISHDVIHSTPESQTQQIQRTLADNLNRDALSAKMNKYYYDTKDTAYSTWSDSDLKSWLVERGIVKTDAQIQREKLQKMVADNYSTASDTVWSAWTDSQMREWLVDHGYLRTDAQKTRDELIKLMNKKYDEAAGQANQYLVWPDARLRAYLRNRGLSEDALPTSRPSLLQEVRIRWVQGQTKAESLLARVRAIINSSVESVEEKIGQIIDVLTGSGYHAAQATEDKANAAYHAGEKYAHEGEAQYHDAAGTVKSKVATASGAIKGAKEWFAGKAKSATAEAEAKTASVKQEL